MSPSSLSALLQINFLGTSSQNSTRNMYIIALCITIMPNINLPHKRNEKEYKESENHSTYKNYICILLKETTYCRMSKEQTFSITVFVLITQSLDVLKFIVWHFWHFHSMMISISSAYFPSFNSFLLILKSAFYHLAYGLP